MLSSSQAVQGRYRNGDLASRSDSEAYKAFLKLVRAINPKIKATTGMPIFNTSKVRGSNVSKQIKDLQERWSKRNAVDGHYVSLSDVISDLPSPIPQFRSMLDFANELPKSRVLRTGNSRSGSLTLALREMPSVRSHPFNSLQLHATGANACGTSGKRKPRPAFGGRVGRAGCELRRHVQVSWAA
jgi:hypothetical protein